MNAVVSLRGLNKSYALKGTELSVIRDLCIDFSAEGITVVVGKSGCGKTTLLKLIAGLEKPSSGTILIPQGMKTGVVFQEARLMPWLTVEKNIAFGLHGRSAQDSGAIRELIELVGLAGFEKAHPDQLSGGMQQRAALARALAIDPDLLLMDEPFAALDYFTRAAMQKELLRIQKARGIGVLMVTHNLDEALLLGDHLICMERGGIPQRHELPGDGKENRDVYSEPFNSIRRSILDQMQRSN
ncbi:MAG: ATP-binding cassette domain-containing protein [Mailhella sp.]|nr:ATP-binding cassette domain-containing protein [Mailhella sp.]